jgi:hypothetical protein
VIVVLNASLNFAIIFGLFTAFLIVSGNFPGLVFLAVIPVLLLQIAFAIGLGMVLGVLNVFFRDVGQFFAIFIQFWFWFTPIVYPASILPEPVRPLLMWNPDGRHHRRLPGRAGERPRAAVGQPAARAGLRNAAVRAGHAIVPQARRRNGG